MHDRARQERVSSLIIDAPYVAGFRRGHRDDLECIGLAIIVLDGDVFALGKTMLMQMVARFLVAGLVLVVVDHPGRSTRSARPMDQDTLPLTLVGPETADPAMSSFARPLLLIEVPFRIE